MFLNFPGTKMKEIKGCVHLYMKDGKPVRVVTHLEELPENGVVHLKSGKIFSDKEFKASHPQDVEEFELQDEGIIISDF